VPTGFCGLAQRALSLYSASDAERVWASVRTALRAAAAATDPERQPACRPGSIKLPQPAL